MAASKARVGSNARAAMRHVDRLRQPFLQPAEVVRGRSHALHR